MDTKIRKTAYFFAASQGDSYNPQSAIISATKKRDEFINDNKEKIEEILDETILINPLNQSRSQFYCVISLAYFPK